jgi:hypothetical protein
MVHVSDFWKYFLLGAIFWVVVDFTTAFNPDINGWIGHMPLIWAFYLGSPLLFAYLIYKKKWGDKRLFLPLLIVLFIVEILFSFNTLLFTFPIMLVMIPLALSIYGFITYVPRWLVDKTLKKHILLTAIMFFVWAIVAILSYTTRA